MIITQNEFDHFVRDYNADYLLLLRRASIRHFDCLITSWLILKDLYAVILTIYDRGEVIYNVFPHPFSFRGNDLMLESLGFSPQDISNIYSFLKYVKESQGQEFEEVMMDGAKVMCKRLSG